MLNVSNGQLYVFLFSLLIGMGVGLIIFLLNLLPTFISYKVVRVIVQTICDFISPIVFMLSNFIAGLILNYGIIRWFIVLAVSLGCYISIKICGKFKLVILRVLNKSSNKLNSISD